MQTYKYNTMFITLWYFFIIFGTSAGVVWGVKQATLQLCQFRTFGMQLPRWSWECKRFVAGGHTCERRRWRKRMGQGKPSQCNAGLTTVRGERGGSSNGQGEPPNPHTGLTSCQPTESSRHELPSRESPWGRNDQVLVSLPCSAIGWGGLDRMRP